MNATLELHHNLFRTNDKIHHNLAYKIKNTFSEITGHDRLFTGRHLMFTSGRARSTSCRGTIIGREGTFTGVVTYYNNCSFLLADIK